MEEKIIIYQILVRLFGNINTNNKFSGTIEENGVGKFNDINHRSLREIRKLGISHIWYIGVLAHATMTDYTNYKITKDYYEIVKGRAGSPYAVKDFYDVCPDLAENVNERIKEFELLIDRTHQNGLKVIIDFVPNHVARNYCSNKKPKGKPDLGENDNTTLGFDTKNDFYYLVNQKFELPDNIRPLGEKTSPKYPFTYREEPVKVSGNDCFKAKPDSYDWYETVKLNYGINFFDKQTTYFNPIPPLWGKMRDILIYWVKKGVDGFRCDMAQMVPVEFWKWLIPQIKAIKQQTIFIAEIYEPNRYIDYIQEGHFDYLYDKSTFYDMIKEIVVNNASANHIISCWQSTEKISEKMLKFLENHDEHRIASPFFAKKPKKSFPAMVVTATLTTSATMIYFGQEIGEKGKRPYGFSGDDGRTSVFDYGSMIQFRKWVNNKKFNNDLLSKRQKKIRQFYQKLFHTIRNFPAISKGHLYDLQYFNIDNPNYPDNDVYSYFRHTDNQTLLIIVNFRSTKHHIKLRIPTEAFHFITTPLPLKGIWKVIDLLSEKTHQLKIGNLEKEGISISVEPYQAFIFNIFS